MSDFIARLAKLQNELKAPKNQYNSFGKYKYRSAEDILEAVKPLAAENELLIFLSDEIVACGNRIYVKATATVVDSKTNSEQLEATAFAREPEDKKGMDSSQITGTASSYARKYALNGLLCIDDTKDADTDQYIEQTNSKPASQPSKPPVCTDCGKQFAGCTMKGKLYSAFQVAEMAKKMSDDGKPRCKACREKFAPKEVGMNEL